MKGASSLTGKCHTFDVKADGYIKAEGINAVVVKRYSDAIRNGDPIRAVIRGIATNSDGRTPGIASPSAEAQISAVHSAYAHAGITNLADTAYLECHGTGTQAGDPTEVNGMASVFSVRRPPDKPLIIGSIKSNIGHSEPAAGISGLLKAILAVENGVIPGNPTFVDPNPKINWQSGNIKASRTAISWPKDALRRASVNSFGYGGSNAHVVLEDARMWTKPRHVSSYLSETAYDDFFADEPISVRPRQNVLVFSANDEASLKESMRRLKNHLINPKVKVELPDLAYTLSERRSRHFYRAFAVSDSPDFDDHTIVYGKKKPMDIRIGFVFTGQGAQWSQMGKQLVETFPQAKKVLRELDAALQSLEARPKWSLLEELTEVRSPAKLREPEFSQPLVTALQLCIISVLSEWGISPSAVVGHSSGEIAAACAAGLISREDAIKAAFYRGEAARRNTAGKESSLGMMAVGVGSDVVSTYLEDTSVQIACYNSPSSLTLSGLISELEAIRVKLVADNQFARLLQVDLAYHSTYMEEIGKDYKNLLGADFNVQPPKTTKATMFSTVTGKEMKTIADSAYWTANMVSPVRFDEGASAMLESENTINFLVEIGPSGALAGPLKQILKNLPGGGSAIQYHPALSRGRQSVNSTFEVAGNLFLVGGKVKWDKVNCYDDEKPSFIVDLPNYAWNHSEKYWYESIASKDWRYRMFPHHDLLGSKLLGDSYHAPTWQKTLLVEDIPWVKDHKMGPEIVFPAAGFIAMGIEAMHQVSTALSKLEGRKAITRPCYKLRNMTFPKALVLEEGEKHRLMLTLSPRTGLKSIWYDYKVFSLKEDTWHEHSRGLITIQEASDEKGSVKDLKSLELPGNGLAWYKAMEDAGYGFGPLFQRQLHIEAIAGERRARATVDMRDPPSAYPQSYYPIHPACLDGCLQTCAPSLWAGRRNSVNAVLVPAIIDELTVVQQDAPVETGIGISTAKYVGLGRKELTKNFMSDSSIYDMQSENLLVRISGLRYHKLDTRESPYEAHKYSSVVWKPDFEHLSELALDGSKNPIFDSKLPNQEYLHVLLDLAAHKKPRLRVMEIVSVANASDSLWLDVDEKHKSARDATTNIKYATVDSDGMLAVQERHEGAPNVGFAILNIKQPLTQNISDEEKYDLVIVRIDAHTGVHTIAENIKRLLTPKGRLLLLQYNAVEGEPALANGHLDGSAVFDELAVQQFTQLLHLPWDEERSAPRLYLCAVAEESSAREKAVEVVSFAKDTSLATSLVEGLKVQHGWNVVPKSNAGSLVLIVDDLSSPTLPNINEEQWEKLKALSTGGNKILWVSYGSQMDVTNPNGAMIHGLARTIRAEDPSLRMVTLDVEKPSGPMTLSAIDKVLNVLFAEGKKAKTGVENEFVERNGVLHVSRIRADDLVNKADKVDKSGAGLVNTKVHEAGTTIRLYAERLGTIDSLTYSEVSSEELPLGDNRVEVEIEAAGVNFKDLAITMGIVPENEFLLGLEGAGTIRRAGSTNYRVGQRVLVFEKGTYANRIIATTERVYPIPDSMTYEEASTLASVYLTALYSIYDLADTHAGHVRTTLYFSLFAKRLLTLPYLARSHPFCHWWSWNSMHPDLSTYRSGGIRHCGN